MRVLGEWLLTPERAALHLPTGTAVVADLHLGYGRVRRRAGEAVPARPVAAELAPLRTMMARHGAARLVIAGDLLEDGRCRAGELLEELRTWLDEAKVELAGVVPGNHDRGLAGAALPVCPGGVDVGGWAVVHGDGALPEGRVVHGHEHPWLRWARQAGGPCYLVGEGRLVLPAYSADAAGVGVLGARRWAEFSCCVIAGNEILDFGEVRKIRIV